VIIITSDQGLCGSYHSEIFTKLEPIIQKMPEADYFVIGKKGQHFCQRYSRQVNFQYFPYDISESVNLDELRPLIGMFYYYDQIYLVYSHFINTTKRDVLFIELTVPNLEKLQVAQEKIEGKYIFEPGIDELINQVNSRIRYALFRQQILDSKLALYTAQMVAMKTASDNAQNLLGELKLEYNKARRKLVDKKINEVQAGRSLWATEN
jgi:F-type H+-transporting ATPase subunit gamma